MRTIGFLMVAAACAAEESATRGIFPEEVIRARPQAKAGASVAAKVKYQAQGPAMSRPSAAGQIGVTIWRLRPAGASDSGARLLIQEEGGTVELIPERVSSASSLRAGDRVRLTLESPEAGYLYVIDRERYSSGERGTPYLIFPTARTRGGDNRVTGGKLIDIPGQEDRPNYFTLRKGRADQVEEELTVLLTREPLEGITPGEKALALSSEQAAEWEKKWGGSKFEIFELAGGTGKAWTAAEQRAASDGTRLLTQDDPPPQTVYRAAVKSGEPLLVKVRLKYGVR